MTRVTVIGRRGYNKSMKGDEMSLEISSYPITAAYLAERLAEKGSTICELCCGVGVSLLKFSDYFDRVIGVDNDAKVIADARRNLQEEKVKNVTLIEGDIEDSAILASLDVDIVAYDIPYWNDYGNGAEYKNPDLRKLISAVRKTVSNQIVIYAPPHVDYESIAAIFDDFEYQQVWIGDRHDRNFIYMGTLASKHGRTKIVLKNSSAI